MYKRSEELFRKAVELMPGGVNSPVRAMRQIGRDPIFVERGEGCWLFDVEGNRYLDALSALYCVNIGYGPWPGIAEAAKRQVEDLPFFSNWVGFAHEPALALADKLSELLPIDVGRVLLVGAVAGAGGPACALAWRGAFAAAPTANSLILTNGKAYTPAGWAEAAAIEQEEGGREERPRADEDAVEDPGVE